MNVSTLSIAQLKKAIVLKEKIAQLESELGSILGTSASTSSTKPAKRGMSAAGRKAVAAAQKKRWAKIKGVAKAAPVKSGPVKAKMFTMSASAKAAISKAAKLRWAKIKAAKAKNSTTKKA